MFILSLIPVCDRVVPGCRCIRLHSAPLRPEQTFSCFFLLPVLSGAEPPLSPSPTVLSWVSVGRCSFAADTLAPPPGRLQPQRDCLDPAFGTQSSQPGRLHMRSRCRSGSGAPGPDGFHVNWSSRGILGKAAPVLMLIRLGAN